MHSLSARFGAVMMGDIHNGDSGYMIRSLYFDTMNDIDFGEKEDGLELRRKIRLRTYSPKANFAMLEMKQKEGPYQKKRSLRLPREDAERLVQGDYAPLLREGSAFAAECYGLMHRQCYRPKTIVEYDRMAFVARENKIRITFDHNIRATEASFDLFSENLLMYQVLDPWNAVLEVKYNGFLLQYIKNLVNAANRSELSVSKYVLARSVSKTL